MPGLRAQAVRAATSVAWNLVEGCGCSSRKEFLSYVENSLSSLNELEAQLLTAIGTSVIAPSTHRRLQSSIDLVRRMLLSLATTLRRRIAEDEAAERGEREEEEETEDAPEGQDQQTYLDED